MKILEITKGGYIVKLSVGFDLRIEESELSRAMGIWRSGDIGKFKQGMIMGKFIAGIIEDKDREVVRDFDPGTGKRFEGMRPLRDVFGDVKLIGDKKLLD
jgi:hypothetical protein